MMQAAGLHCAAEQKQVVGRDRSDSICLMMSCC
jgi:hypothetical protein